MKENLQGRFCPNCGAWNLIINEQCTTCGADLLRSSEGKSDDGTWRIIPDDIAKEPGPSIVTENFNSTVPKSKQLVRALVLVCCFLAVTAAIGLLRSGKEKQPEPITKPAVESENSVVSEISVISEESEALPENEAEEREYTAPSLRLTSFGGETTGDELVIHSHVHDNYNNEYAFGLGGTRSSVENITEYFIGDQYKYFSFRIVLNYERRTDYHPDTYVRIYADGSQVYKSKLVRSGFKPEDVTLDIRGVKKLRVGICGWGDIRIVDPVLHNDEGYEQYSTIVPYTNKQALDRVPLSYLEYWNGSSAEGGLRYITTPINDSEGNVYDTGYAGTHENQDNWVEYDINDCGYTKLIGTVIMNADPGGADTVTPVVAVYEGAWLRELYKSDPVTQESGIQHFEVSLKNAPQFRLQISGRHNIRLVDCYLCK